MSENEERRIWRRLMTEVKRLWEDLKLEQKRQRQAEQKEFRQEVFKRTEERARALVREMFADMREQWLAELEQSRQKLAEVDGKVERYGCDLQELMQERSKIHSTLDEHGCDIQELKIDITTVLSG